jgi:hypothetical protein
MKWFKKKKVEEKAIISDPLKGYEELTREHFNKLWKNGKQTELSMNMDIDLPQISNGSETLTFGTYGEYYFNPNLNIKFLKLLVEHKLAYENLKLIQNIREGINIILTN